MQINKTDGVDFEAASSELLDALQQQRADLIGGSIDIHVGIGLLAGVEADRLTAKYGADDTRVKIMRDRSEAATARVDALSVEQEIAMVRTPPPPPATGAQIQGRITDLMKRTAGKVTVQIVDEKGQAVAGIAPVETDAAGYFAFELTPEAVKATAQSKLSVLVRAADVQLVPAAAEPVVIAAGATRVMDVQLSSAELEKLRLRMPFSPDKIVVRPPDVVVTPAPDKPPVKDPPVRDPPVKNPAPIETKDPVKPVTPVEPAKPVEPTKPVDTKDPVKPVTPVEPAKPAEPTRPTVPTRPIDSTKPVEPAKPAEPVKPVRPTTTDAPRGRAAPNKPKDKPDKKR